MANSEPKPGRDHARVRVFPPLVLLGAVAAGLALEAVFPVDGPHVPAWVGIGLVGGSILLGGWAIVTLKRHDTTHGVQSPTTRLVDAGPFRCTRNPIYVAGILLCLGVAGIVESVWFIVSAAVATVAIRWAVIEQEEAYLERKFGEAYRTYKQSVRRWL